MDVGEKMIENVVVQALKDILGGYCADLSASMKFGTDVERNILN